ncbi:MAG: hypothetical protein WCK29_04290, partial [archaeon]
MYSAHARVPQVIYDEQPIGDFRFVDAGTKKDLRTLVESHIYTPDLPSEIKVTRPEIGKDLFGLFVKD